MADYAARLSAYPNKGVCGLPERTDSARVTSTKLRKLADMVREANHVVVLTGAGISTSAGIPDFRGPNGVWTLEKKREREEKRRRKREAALAKKAASETSSGGEDGGGETVEGSQSESELPAAVVKAVAQAPNAASRRPVDGGDGNDGGGGGNESPTGVEQQQEQRRQQKNDRDDEGEGGGTSRDCGADEKEVAPSAALASDPSAVDDDMRGAQTAGSATAQSDLSSADAGPSTAAAAKCDAQNEEDVAMPQCPDSEHPPPSKRQKTQAEAEEAETASNPADPAADSNDPTKPTTSAFQKARPTFTHRAITAMVERDLIQYCVTQNVDGLHRRSGLPRSKMSVLHGCVFTERCERCQREHFRTFDVGGVSFKRTGRTCDHPDCDGHLRDTILDWEDELPHGEFALATEHCKGADLVLCLGTSLRIEPAGSLPLLARRFVVVNMQDTPRDKRADLVIRARVDDVMADLTARLGVLVPGDDDDDDDDDER